MIHMPGAPFTGDLPPLTEEEIVLRDELERLVRHLADVIGERNVFRPGPLQQSVDFIREEFHKAGYDVSMQGYEVRGVESFNIEVEIPGTDRADEIVLIGGHYDSVIGSPGANDNATGAAATIALARHFAEYRPSRTLRFVAFVNEEPPFFQTHNMGSLVYARRSRERGEHITAMISLETIGYYSDEPGSQRYPFPLRLFYPSKGNFIGFIGNVRSRDLVRRAIGVFREDADFPSEGAALPGSIPGVGWSDHWSFWRQGYPAIMVTDTALYRYPHYHSPRDTWDRVDYDRTARVVAGLIRVIEDLVDGE